MIESAALSLPKKPFVEVTRLATTSRYMGHIQHQQLIDAMRQRDPWLAEG